jgi:hypothetical protein
VGVDCVGLLWVGVLWLGGWLCGWDRVGVGTLTDGRVGVETVVVVGSVGTEMSVVDGSV